MPAEISDVDRFIKLSENASECRVKRLEKEVKLKIRTPGRLYTIKLDVARAEEVLKQVKCEIREV